MLRLAALAVLVPAVAVAAPTERRLHADQVTASSFLWNDWNRFQENYHPLYVSDDDPKTAWVEGASGDGVGEWLRLKVTPMEGATQVRLHVRNGYQKSPSLFQANARPKEVTIVLLPGNVEKKVRLTDAEGWQDVVVAQPAGKLEGVELKIGSVYKGTRYTDTCISDIEVFVTADTKENPAFEKSKLDNVLAWKAERVAAAQTFKKGAKDLPLLPQYNFVEGEEASADDEALWNKCKDDNLCWTRESLAKSKDPAAAIAGGALGAAAVPARLAPTDTRRLPTVDGLTVPNLYDAVEHYAGSGGLALPDLATVASLRADQLGAIQLEGAEAKVALADALAAKAPGCKTKAGKTYVWMTRDKVAEGAADAGRERVRALLIVHCGRVETRDGKEDVALPQLVAYAENGELALTAGPGYVHTFRWKDHVLVGGSAQYAGGRKAELTGPNVAAK